MADELPRAAGVTNLTPEEVAAGLREGRILLVDVREPNETSVESYPDAVIVPLSCFDPTAIPDPQGKQVVFACRSGRRSITASVAAQDAGYPYSAHLAGGIIAWKAAGLPTKTWTIDTSLSFFTRSQRLLWLSWSAPAQSIPRGRRARAWSMSTI